MDPDKTFNRIVDLLLQDAFDQDDMDEACAALLNWLRAGGFAPAGFRSRWESDERARDYLTEWGRQPRVRHLLIQPL
jgi:hypothetical protein